MQADEYQLELGWNILLIILLAHLASAFRRAGSTSSISVSSVVSSGKPPQLSMK